jgi:hypothetical protein
MIKIGILSKRNIMAEPIFKRILGWQSPGDIQHLSPTDLAVVGASSGGLLALTGSGFGALLESNARIRVLDNSAEDQYCGALGSYDGIMGNTPWLGHLSGIHETLLHQLIVTDIGQEAQKHIATSPRLGRLGVFLNTLGKIATNQVQRSLNFFEIDFDNHVDLIQLLDRGGFRVYGTKREGLRSTRYYFETMQLYLATGAKPKHLSIPVPGDRIMSPTTAVSEEGIRRIKETCGEDDVCVIIGSMHTAAAIMTSLGLEHDLYGVNATPQEIYDATPEETATRINRWYRGPRIIVLRRGLGPPRICFRVRSIEQAWSVANELEYDGSMYVSNLTEGNEVVINSHGSLEKPHAQVMLAAYNKRIERMQVKIIGDDWYSDLEVLSAKLYINATGYTPVYVPMVGSNGEPLQVSPYLTDKGELLIWNGSTLLNVRGLYTNGIMAPLKVSTKTIVKEILRGNLDDLTNAPVVGVFSSRERGERHVEEIVEGTKKKRQTCLI